MRYEKPVMEIALISEDVITTSGGLPILPEGGGPDIDMSNPI